MDIGALRIPRGAVQPYRPPVRRPGPLKVALIGGGDSLVYAPWHDQSWEIWSHASIHTMCEPGRVVRFFDLHPKAVWNEAKPWRRDYVRWLQRLQTPIYMQEKYAEIPASVRYPKELVLSQFRRYVSGHAGWMIALALIEGATEIGFFGIHYASASEYAEQRAGCEYWMGVAEGRGVKLTIPAGCPLLHEPAELYGYESHTPERYETRKQKANALKASARAQAPMLTLTPIAADAVQAECRKDLTWGEHLGDAPNLQAWKQWEQEPQTV
jgi:hypothetical protein